VTSKDSSLAVLVAIVWGVGDGEVVE